MPEPGTGWPRDRLLALVEQILSANSITGPISAVDPLTSIGLASIDMVHLMLAVEAEFNITIPAEDITPDNFYSITAIEALIVKVDPGLSRP